ncbi:hypothetical protein Dda_4190 [Drechslerella dactyloides]|uniref:Uncharacterized protein n=1 Tax=Drechslerella dactyloides TaxID=74499 RepID=A0AAD6NKM1_DREDA|nr:hypothetical protein Dda_4190 [Drechslerella dactyloides]
MSSSGSGTSLGSTLNPQDMKAWAVDGTPERDYGAQYEVCVDKGKFRIQAYEDVLSTDAPDLRPVPVAMSAPSTDYLLEVQTDPDEVSKNTERLTKKNNGMRKILEQNYFDRNPDVDPATLSHDDQVIASDYRQFSVNHPSEPYDDIFDRAYVGWVSQADKTIVLARRYKDQDRASNANKAFPSDITFAVWSHIVARRWDPDIEPLEVHELQYIAMNDVVNPQTVVVCRQAYKSEGIDLNNDAETRDGLYIYPGSKDWEAFAGAPNVASIWRMVTDHHHAFRNRKPTKMMVKFRPYRFNMEETGYSRLIDRNDDALKGKWFIGITLG